MSWRGKIAVGVTFFIAIVAVIAGAYELAYLKTIIPRVIVAGVEVSNLDRNQALGVIQNTFDSFPNRVVVKVNGEEKWNSDGVMVARNFEGLVDEALMIGRTGDIVKRWKSRVEAFYKPIHLRNKLVFDDQSAETFAAMIEDKIATEGALPRLEVFGNEVKIQQGVDGVKLDTSLLSQQIEEAFLLPGEQTVRVSTRIVENRIDQQKSTKVLDNAKYWLSHKLSIKYKKKELVLNGAEIVQLLSLTKSDLNEDEYENLVEKLRDAFEQSPVNAAINIEGERVKEFTPEQDGLLIEYESFKKVLAVNLNESHGSEIEIPMVVTKPKVSMDEINDLGIKTLIGVGTSKFHGSIPNRVFNLNLAASRVNGIVIPPGEEFSFNKAVGSIDRASGYKSAYVISAGRTVLGDGGGVCQVSTTLFRAAMNAGLPIVERKAHAYRVHYYEEDTGPGFDATVYSPSVDFKFKNDTPGHILIQSSVDTKNMAMKFEFYGTDDGRVATISAARISSQSPPPSAMYQDDPTLKTGVVKQVDWAAWGARSEFDYVVTRNGEEIGRRKFVSSYKPWQAIYLRGTGI